MAYQFKNASVLVVDDMQPMLSLVTSLLKIFGFEKIYTANNVDDGFVQFCKVNPDLVLTDWMMEPQDGLVLADKIRKDPKSPNRFVPIVMMTGYSHKVRVLKARDMGVTEFLVKPFRATDLYARIEQLIERPRKFVDAEEFFGPDRRRRKGDDYAGPRRRESDEEYTLASEQEAAQLLRELQQKARAAGAKKKDDV